MSSSNYVYFNRTNFSDCLDLRFYSRFTYWFYGRQKEIDETMTFTDALSAVFNDGDLITREVWNQRAEIGLDDGKLSINGYLADDGKWVGDGKWRAWFVTEQDFYATDWEVVE